MIGEAVLAIGNPLGYHHTLTTGVISALHRTLAFPRSVQYEDLIQTDASINPGNSGGPLLNILGELIGVNTAIRGDAENIGFAIPVDRLSAALPDMLSPERLRRLQVGMSLGGGGSVIVEEVVSGSPAHKAGLRKGDRVVAVDETPVRQHVDVYFLLLGKAPGDRVSLTVERSGKRKTLKLKLKATPVPDGAQLARKLFGLKIGPLDASVARTLQLEGGVVVEGASRGGPAYRAGFREGMIITTISGDYTRDVDQVGRILEQVKPGETVIFHVWQVERLGNRFLIRPHSVALPAAG